MVSPSRLRTSRKIRILIAAGCSITLLAAAACSGSSTTAASSTDSSANEIVLGFALSQSGNMAPFDQEPGNAAMLRVKELNASGGINGKTIRVISKDVRSSPETVGTAATELIAQGINLLVTPCDFDLSAPGAAIAQAASVPTISICAGDPKMADSSTLGDFVFSANAGSDVEGASGAAWATDKGWKSAYVLQDQSIEYTKSAGSYFQAAFEGLGGTVVGKDAFPGGDNIDISSQVSRLKAVSPKPDFIYVASWNPGGATAIRQLREGGIEIPVVGPAALDGQVLLDIVGNASDIFYTAFACYAYCSGQNSPELDKFVSDYETEYKAKPASSYALLGYNMISAIATNLEGVASLDGAAVRDALVSGKKVKTPIGDVTYFTPTCHKITDMPMTVIAVADGKMTFESQQRVKSLPDIGDGNTCAA